MKYRDYAYYAYTAGIIDSDGCIRIAKRKYKKHRNPIYCLEIKVEQKDGRCIDFLVGFWGGKVAQNSRNYYIWRVRGRDALLILQKIFPFLRYKRPQADVAVQFELYRQKIEGEHNKYRYPAHAFAKFEKYYQKVRELKKIVSPCFHLQRLSEATPEKEEATVSS